MVTKNVHQIMKIRKVILIDEKYLKEGKRSFPIFHLWPILNPYTKMETQQQPRKKERKKDPMLSPACIMVLLHLQVGLHYL